MVSEMFPIDLCVWILGFQFEVLFGEVESLGYCAVGS